MLSTSTSHPPVACVVDPKYLKFELLHGIRFPAKPASLKHYAFFLLISNPFLLYTYTVVVLPPIWTTDIYYWYYRNPLVYSHQHHWHRCYHLDLCPLFFCFLFLLFFDNVTSFPWILVACSYSCFGFLDFDLIQFMNLFLSAKLPLDNTILLSLCGFLNLLIPPPCPIFSALSTTWFISEFVLRHRTFSNSSNYTQP